jgi:LCP family protein required for cell wall assembly
MDHSLKRLRDTSSSANVLWWGMCIAFVMTTAATAYLTFVAVRNMVLSWSVTQLPGIAVNEESPARPVAAEAFVYPTPQPWDGASRVSVLVMGLDYRDWERNEGAPRTDTMILLSLDPLTRTAGVLSIPRDLWVTIPGFEPNRINMAYRLGEVYQLPGGGAGLAMKTVEGLLGLKIDYYALIDFYAFERFIDEIGGVKLEITEAIKVDPIGDNNTKVLKPGVQVLPGSLALAYARARNTEGADFDRARRQQQVIMGIRDRLLSQEALLGLIGKAPRLYEELSAGVHTNLTMEEAIKLAWLARQIPRENIKMGVIGPPEYVNFGVAPDGQQVVKPVPSKIRMLRDEVFTAGGVISPANEGMDLQQLVQAEDAKIALFNATVTPGLAASTQIFLQKAGFLVEEAGNATQVYPYTLIVDHTGNPYTLKALLSVMGLPADRIYHRFDPTDRRDIVIFLGEDWAKSNPMP